MTAIRSRSHTRLSAVLILSVAAMLSANAIMAVSPYPTLKDKAERFFRHREWASAAAMFDLMLEEHPEVPQTYGQAIVANGMRENSDEQARLMTLALDNHIPFDSVFASVKKWSFHIGRPLLFEDFLKVTCHAHPWMQRNIDGQLLKYYTARSNGEGMVAYSIIMLEGAPDNIGFLESLAAGYMITGDNAQGISAYKRIVSLDPDNYNALLVLGNWYAEHPEPDENPLAYLQHANALHATPYVSALIERLTANGK